MAIRFWINALLDLACAAFREQVSQQILNMKSIPPKTWSLILFIVAIGATELCVKVALTHGSPALFITLFYLSAIALIVRAVVEWTRPMKELIRSLIWGAAIAIIYALILPVLAKLQLMPTGGAGQRIHDPILGALIVAGIALNGFVPLTKTVKRILRPQA